MTYTFNDINNILKTLPIGYYINKNIEVELNETDECSSFNLMTSKIIVSYKQILKTLASCKDDELEETIRTNLYHEVSHAFLTPKHLNPNYAINVVEDERIETVLKYYYLNVNFKEMVKKMNGYHGEKPTSADAAFYHLVRYRVGEENWLTRLENLLKKYKTLTRNSDYYSTRDYKDDINTFYNDFVGEWKPKNEEKENNSTNSSSNESNTNTDNTNKDNTNDDNTNDDKTSKTKQANVEVSEINSTDDEIAKEIETAKALISKVVNTYSNSKLAEQLNSILTRISSSNKRNGSAINSYSGVFDPRSVARNDYKYFVQKNRNGNVKMYSKNHLNLFIDVSGSFSYSQNITNTLLHELYEFEKANPNFSYDVVTINTEIHLCKKNERQIKCCGGNRLRKELYDVVKSLQYSDKNTYNIVLFDGDAVSDAYDRVEERKNFGAFNRTNLTIISDYDNKSAIEKYCPSAKKIFTSDYAKELIKNVLTSLETFAR